jgi:hypothetical protein
MTTKEKQYLLYENYLHVERIKMGLICTDRKPISKTTNKERGRMIKPYITMGNKRLYSMSEWDHGRCTYNCKLCDYKVIRDTVARIKVHIADHHPQYCISCDNCFAFFTDNSSYSANTYKGHICK